MFDSTINIINCNYLNNKFTGDDKGIIVCDNSCSFSNCSFIGNIGNYLFDQYPNIGCPKVRLAQRSI